MTSLTTEKLADLIAKRHACLLQLRDLGRRQSALISTGEMGTLLRLISAKNRLIVAMQAIEQQLSPYHSQDPETRSWSSQQARATCADQAAQCRELLEEVMQLERDNEQLMATRRDEVASRFDATISSTRLGEK